MAKSLSLAELEAWLREEYRRLAIILSEYPDSPTRGTYGRAELEGRARILAEVEYMCRSRSLPAHQPISSALLWRYEQSRRDEVEHG